MRARTGTIRRASRRVRRAPLNASANAYEFTGFALEGADFKRGGKRLSTIGSYVGGVLGDPIIHSRNWRLGFSVTKPVSWSPSRVEGQIPLTGTTGDESFLYSSYVSLSTVIPALNVGYRLGDRLRLGVGLGWAHTSLYQNTSLSDRLLTPTGASTALRNFETDGSTDGLLVSAGVQADVGSGISLGALVTAPGVRIGGSSRVTYQATAFSGAVSRDLAFRDDQTEFDYRLPLAATVGAAIRFGKAEVEFDLRYHGTRDRYVLYSSAIPAALVTTDAAGAPTQSTLAFADVTEETKAVYNLAIGGHYSFSPGFRVHAGFFTDDSPVGSPETSIFRELNLVGFSGGTSFGAGRLTASVGISGSHGTSDERMIGPSLGGATGSTKVTVTTYNLLYAVSYAF